MGRNKRLGGEDVVDLDKLLRVAVAVEGGAGFGGEVAEPQGVLPDRGHLGGTGVGVKVPHQHHRQRLLPVVGLHDGEELLKARLPRLGAEVVEMGVVKPEDEPVRQPELDHGAGPGAGALDREAGTRFVRRGGEPEAAVGKDLDVLPHRHHRPFAAVVLLPAVAQKSVARQLPAEVEAHVGEDLLEADHFGGGAADGPDVQRFAEFPGVHAVPFWEADGGGFDPVRQGGEHLAEFRFAFRLDVAADVEGYCFHIGHSFRGKRLPVWFIVSFSL